LTRIANLTLLLCFLSATAIAQPFVIRGAITDLGKKQPIEHVNIYAPQNEVGAVSDAAGNFVLNLPKLPDTLVISCIGFATIKWPLRSAPAAPLAIVLHPQSDLLPEVSVSALKKAKVIYPPEYSVVDYELYQGLPLLLVCKNSLSGYWLVALDENDQIRGELRLKRLQPEALFKSCLGGIYLIMSNGAYVVELHEGVPVLTEIVTLHQINQLILPCVGANDQFIYFSRWRYKNQMLSYEAAPRNGGPHLLIKTVLDEAQLTRLAEEGWFRSVQVEHAKWLFGSLKPYQVENMIDHLVEDQNTFADRFVYTAIKASLFAQNERLCLFNHTNDYLEWMKSNGESLRRIPIQYHLDKNWKSEILHDEATKRFYTLMDHGKNTLVLEINTYDGTTSEFLLLDKPSVQKVKVFNGRLYFLYKDFDFSERNLKLHRVG
jgi:hypothetical protein